MSDYLWDKTGEADAEVERLERLLGAFGHAPRPLELPAGAAPAAPRPRGLYGLAGRLRASSLFAPAGLAAAAALLLAFILGAAALSSRSRVATDDGRAAARETRQTWEGARERVAPTPSGQTHARAASAPRTGETPGGAREIKAGAGGAKDDSAAVVSLAPRRRKGAGLAAVQRRQKPSAVAPGGRPEAAEGLTVEAMRAGGGGASAFVEGTRLLTKEQLVYALRLTGAKLRDVRQRAQGLDGSESRPR
ncbi:MAG TPA: hypothetical protein VF611_20955 [Pyrinomonadaceae bacterium]|jgi:hypothetical protein